MSAPPGTGRSRASTKSRGSSRGAGRSRGSSNGAGTGHTGRRLPSGTLPGHETQRNLKPSVKQNQTRNKQWRNPAQLSSPTTSHANKLTSSKTEPWRNAATENSATYKSRMNDLYQALKENRERERKQAIEKGFLADPDRPTSLANAITPVGTCQDMCPEFERVERIVQLMVDGSEKETAVSGAKVPCEALMVKRFRRSAAGYDEQLPSDIRPPSILKKTLDYLVNEVIGGSEPLAIVHKFVWDRTRGIRNDFSIQQVSRTEDLRIAIDCFERIARFHILSLHQLSRSDLKDNEFNHHQEREQLNNTLLSLMYYYDDSRHKLRSPNEAEFRAYCIIFEIQDQRPDLEDRAQNWPRQILKDSRVQTALKVYAAASNTSDEQGPLRPRTPFSTAQANSGGFWSTIRSNAVSYLTACVAEIYFNLVRSTTLEVIWKAYRGKRGGSTKIGDWILPDLTGVLGFDNDDQTAQFCEEHEFMIEENEAGDRYIDLGSVAVGRLRDSNPRRRQIFSRTLVESKRHDRTLPAIINGLTASQAQSQGLVEEMSEAESLSDANSESLFIDEDSDIEQRKSRSRSGSPPKPESRSEPSKLNPNPFQSTTIFGQPSSKPNPFLSAATPPSREGPTPPFSNHNQIDTNLNPFAKREVPKLDPFQRPSVAASEATLLAVDSPVNNGTLAFNPFQRTTDSTSETNSASINFSTSHKTPTFDFFSSSGVGKAHTLSTPNTNNGQTQAQTTSSVFGRPSASIESNASVLSPPQPDHATTSSSPNKAPLGIENAAQPETTTNSFVRKQDEQRLFPPQAETPKFSFGTSVLFQKSPNAANKAPLNATSDSLFTQDSPQIYTENQKKATTFPSSAHSTESKPLFLPSSTLSQTPILQFPSQTTSSEPKINLFQPPTTTTQPNTPEKPVIGQQKSVDPSLQPSTIASNPGDNASLFATAPKTSTGSSSLQPLTRPPRPDPRPKALDELARNLIYEDRGLLQQFIEYTAAPIIRSSIVRFQDERSWARARECRTFLLAKKFFKRWKSKAWDRGLKRRGKERRRMFAQSIRDNSHSPSPKLSEFEGSPFSRILRSQGERLLPKASTHMQPSSSQDIFMKTLPARLGENEFSPINNSSPNLSLVGVKRKRDEANSAVEGKIQPNSDPRHKRSNTTDSLFMPAPSHRMTRRNLRRSVDHKRAGDGSLLGDTLMRQARRLAKNTKSDTTHTDYFKLKAMGVEPDTPIVPQTKERPRAATYTSKNPKSDQKGLTLASHDTQAPSTPSRRLDDDDEAFFASIRSVRETLADSTSWFQTERQSIERDMTPKTTKSPVSSETPAERRLREMKERGPVPTRAELRQRAMGDKSLLSEGLWGSPRADSSSYGKEKGRSSEQPSSTTAPGRLMGLAALAEQRQGKELVNGNAGLHEGRGSPFQQKGASVEDAIEL